MRQERTVQATLFEVFAQHEIGCELKAMAGWPARSDQPGGGRSAAAGGARDRAAGIAGGKRAALCPAQAAAPALLRRTGLSPRGFGVVPRLCPPAVGVVAKKVGAAPHDRGDPR